MHLLKTIDAQPNVAVFTTVVLVSEFFVFGAAERASSRDQLQRPCCIRHVIYYFASSIAISVYVCLSVCLSVCPLAYLKIARPNFTTLSVHVTGNSALVLF